MQIFKIDPPQTSNALHIRRMVDWTRDAKTRPENQDQGEYRYRNGQHLARRFAELHGYAVILWNDGHTTLFVAD